MTAFEFLAYLRRLEVKVWADGDQLRVRGPKEALTPAVRADLAQHKAELLTLMQQARLSSQPAAPPLRALAREQSALPLSFAQERLWFIDALQPGSAVYNITGTLRLRGTLKLDALWRSLTTVVARQATLRTSFPMREERPVQWIAPAGPLPLPVVDLRGIPARERAAVLEQLLSSAAQQPFELARGPLVRVKLFRLETTEHVLFTVMHHIISDGWSNTVFVREMLAHYPALAAGRPSPLPPLPVQYADYAIWQRTWLQGPGARGQGATAPLPPPAGGGIKGGAETRRQEDKEIRPSAETPPPTPNTQHPTPMEAQLAYWKAQLKDAPTVLELPTDRPRPPVQTDHGAVLPIAVDAPLTAALLALSQQEHATLFMTLLAAFVTLLYRYSGQEDLVAGTAVAGRTRPELEGLIGFFINTLPLRADLSGGPSFRTLLQRMRAVILSAFAHQDLPFERLVVELQPERDLSRTPLFQVMLLLQNFPAPELDTSDLQIEVLNVGNGTAKFDLLLTLGENPNGLRGLLEYNTDLFDESTIARMATHLQTLLAGIAADPTRRLAELPLMSEAERAQLLVAWNATRTEFRSQESGVRSAALCIPDLFEAQATRTPDRVALVFDQPTTNDQRPTTNDRSPLHPFTPSPVQHLTYRELNVRANCLAHHLRELGVGPEVVVGISLERSPELVIGLLGVLKAGGAYLPLDPAYPPQRLAFMLEDSRAPVLLTTTDDRRPTNDQRPKTEDGRSKIEDRRSPAFDPRSSILDPRSSILDPQSPIPNPQSPIPVYLDAEWFTIAAASPSSPAPHVTPDNLAYVIYTSGSTGQPKGILGLHRGAVNRFAWMWETYPFAPDERCCQKTSLNFLDSLWEIFGPLLQGVPTVIIPDSVLKDPYRLVPALAEMDITRIVLVPSLLRVLLEIYPDLQERLPRLKYWGTSGEALPIDLCQRFLEAMPRSTLLNLYGASEVSADVTWYEAAQRPALLPVPIGRPIANTQVYLLDRTLQPVPVGVPGELCVGGESLARGYFHRPDLTAERFVPNPFAGVTGDGCWVLEDKAPNTQHPTPNTRLYKTGDRARYLPDGVIEYLGRGDQQVKVRGYRIEPGEIEAALLQHSAVHECAVVAREDREGDTRLVAYVVPKIEDRGLKIEDSRSDAPDPLSSIFYPLSSELRAFLQSRLPEYMLPSIFMPLDALPRTPNGKLDRRALPAPDRTRASQLVPFVAPRTPTEALVASVWATVLAVEPIGIHDSFFALGGHSLLATQVLARLRQAAAVELPLRALFEAPTVAALAVRIEHAWQARLGPPAPPITPVARTTALPLSFAQQRLWFLDQLVPGSPLYNVPIAVRLLGPLQLAALAQTLQAIRARHETLRTTFPSHDGQPLQQIARPTPLALTVCDLAALPEREEAAQRLGVAEVQRPFDLAGGPLLRFLLLRLAPADHIAVLTMHHIISDGWSLGVFIAELAALYQAHISGQPSPLPALTVQYADYAVWQRNWLQGPEARRQGTGDRGHGDTKIEDRRSKIEDRGSTIFHPPSSILDSPTPNTQHPTPIEAQLAYWKAQLADVPLLALPADHPRPAIQSYRGATQQLLLPQPLDAALTALSQQENVTLFMTLLAAFQVLLARYSGQDDLVVGTPIANRTHAEIEPLIGFFVNTLVLRTDLSGNPSVRELLGRVREVCLGAYAHQDLPFEMLVEALRPERDLSRQPLFQVLFVLQNAPVATLKSAEMTLRPLTLTSGTAKFDLALAIDDSGEGKVATLEYSADLFDASTITRLLGHFQTLLQEFVADPTRRLAELPLLSAAERAQLLVTWNATARAYPHDACIPTLFTAQAARTPDAVAVVFDRGQGSGVRGQVTTPLPPPARGGTEQSATDLWATTLPPPAGGGTEGGKAWALSPQSSVLSPEQLTYRELDRRANQLAHYLRSLGVGPETRVALAVERSPELLVGLLGILKAGGAYLPLNLAYPAARLAFMLDDAQAPLLLTQRHLEDNLPAYRAMCVYLDAADLAAQPTHSPPNTATPDNLAYVTYTSGSTGTPKGVSITQRGVVRLVAAADYADLSSDAVVLQFAPLAFDASTFEIWGALLNGARLVVFPGATPSLAELSQALQQHQVTTLWLTAGLFHQMVEDQLAGLRYVRQLLTGGDVVSARHAQTVLQRLAGRTLINGYGPTENTTFTCCYPMTQPGDVGPSVPIGRPIANTQVYVLDRALQPVPIGVAGELYIGGDGLARGYLNRPDLTAERFIPNPFARGMGDGGWGMEDASPSPIPHPPSPGTRLYKTGDLVRYLPGGLIEFLGRNDNQVKVRGFRIELGEIEAALVQHPNVQAAAVLARVDGPGEKWLVAYLVTSNELQVTSSQDALLVTRHSSLVTQLRDFLQERLPGYMVPAIFVPMEALPLTPNGKVDRHALPAPDTDRPELEVAFVAPRTDLERVLAQIWADVLGLEQVGVYDSFFDLGGHSLLATQVISRVDDVLQIELPVRELFAAPTVAGLAERIETIQWAVQVQAEAAQVRTGARQTGRL